MNTQVLIVGAGPVGLTLAIDLGRRGVRYTLLEQKNAPEFLPKMEWCNTRTMETPGASKQGQFLVAYTINMSGFDFRQGHTKLPRLDIDLSQLNYSFPQVIYGNSQMGRNHMYCQGRELEIGNAASAVLISLLQTLVDKSVISNTDVRILLTKAASDLGPHDYTAPVKGAIGVILDDILPKFPEDGGD